MFILSVNHPQLIGLQTRACSSCKAEVEAHGSPSEGLQGPANTPTPTNTAVPQRSRYPHAPCSRPYRPRRQPLRARPQYPSSRGDTALHALKHRRKHPPHVLRRGTLSDGEGYALRLCYRCTSTSSTAAPPSRVPKQAENQESNRSASPEGM